MVFTVNEEFLVHPQRRIREKFLSKSKELLLTLFNPIKFLKMKLAVLFLLLGFFQVQASLFAQKITLNEKNARLDKVFKQINKQSGVDFIYKNEQLNKAKPVTIQVTQKPLDEVLNLIFSAQPIGFIIKNQTIIVQDKSVSINSKVSNL